MPSSSVGKNQTAGSAAATTCDFTIGKILYDKYLKLKERIK